MLYYNHMNQRYKLARPDGIMVLVSTLFVAGSLVVSYFASIYATNRASNPVDDFFLNLLPAVDVTLVFIYGFVLFCAFI